MTHVDMMPNGTIRSLKTSNGIELLRQEQIVMVGSMPTIRGGAHVCCPNFGNAPKDGAYRGINLPKHGLVRQCQLNNGAPTPENSASDQTLVAKDADGWTLADFEFDKPWPHTASVKAFAWEREGIQCLEHHLILRASDVTDEPIPYTLGFHPYFATHQQPFRIQYGKHFSMARAQIPSHNPQLFKKQGMAQVCLELDHGTIAVDLLKGYTGFYLWTDDSKEYVCIEPVRTNPDGGHLLLDPGEEVVCSCKIIYKPR